MTIPHKSQARKLSLSLAPQIVGSAGRVAVCENDHFGNKSQVVELEPEMDMPLVLEGGCLCAKVRFRANQGPLRTLVCHCNFCQRMTGSSSYAESLFPIDAVAFNGGETRTYEHTSDGSGKKVYVEFCTHCGTTLGLTFERWPDLRAVSRGCFDNPSAVGVTANIWTRSAQSGVALPAGIDCFSTARTTLDGQPQPSTRHAAPVMARSDSAAQPFPSRVAPRRKN